MARIGFLTSEYLPYPGGIATYVYNTANTLRSLGHDAQVFVFGNQGQGDNKSSNVPCHQVTMRAYSPLKLPLMSWDILKLMKQNPMDLWVAADVRCMVALGIVPTSNKVGVIYGTDVVGNLLEALKKYRIYRPLRHFDRLIAISEFTRHLALENHPYLDEKNIVVSPLAVPERTLATPKSVGEVPISIISVGRKEPRKGLEYAIKAIDNLPKDLRDKVCYRIIGRAVDHEYSNMLDQLAEKSAAQIEIMGAVSNDTLEYHYSNADIFLHPSVPTPRAVEGFGLVLLEASSAGITVVSTMTDAIPEVVVHGHTGLLVEPRNSDALTQALETLIQDPQRIYDMGQQGINHAKTFSWERHVSALTDVL